jgi:ferredoxin like protein
MKEHKKDIEDKLAKVKINIDKEAHISVKKELCPDCEGKPCIPACPAANYDWEESENQLIFNYEGCLECGTCRFICPLDAIEWSYPRGGYGVAYLWG